MRLIYCVVLLPFCVSLFADEFKTDSEGAFKGGSGVFSTGPGGGVKIASGGRDLCRWDCLIDLPGALRSEHTGTMKMENLKREVSVSENTVKISGSFKTREGNDILLNETLTGVNDGVRIDVSFKYPNGKDPIKAMGVPPRGTIYFAADDIGENCSFVSETADGFLPPVKVVNPPSAAPHDMKISAEGVALKSFTVRNDKFPADINIVPGKDSVAVMLDMRSGAKQMRLYVRPGPDNCSFSETIRLTERKEPRLCVLQNTTLAAGQSFIFSNDKPVEMKFKVRNLADKELRGSVKWGVESWPEKKTVASGDESAVCAPGKDSDITVSTKPGKNGLYRFTAELSAGGRVQDSLRFPFAVADNPGKISGGSLNATGVHTGYSCGPSYSAIGAKWLRICSGVSSWGMIEEKKGEFKWDKLDALVNPAAEAGHSVILCVHGCPLWASAYKDLTWEQMLARYSSDPDFNAMLAACGGIERFKRDFMSHRAHETGVPADWADYRNFLEKVLARYGGKIKCVEVSNEADGLNSFFGSPAEYVRMTKETRDTVNKINPQIKVIGKASYTYRLNPFTQAMIQNGVAAHIDAHVAHFYVQTRWPLSGSPEKASIAEGLAAISDEMKKAGKVVPAWCTEFGWAVPPKTDSFPMERAEFQERLNEAFNGKPNSEWFTVSNNLIAVPEDAHADYYIRMIALLQSLGVDVITVHAPYGFFRDAEPFLAAVAQAACARHFTGKKFTDRLPAGNADIYAMRFKQPGSAKCSLIVWTTGEKEDVIFEGAGADVKVFDVLGNPAAVKNEGGKLTAGISQSPLLIIDADDGIKLSEPLKNLSVVIPATLISGMKTDVPVSFENNYGKALTIRFSCSGLDGAQTAFEKAELALPPGEKASSLLTVIAPNGLTGPRSAKINIALKADDLNAVVSRSFAVNFCSPKPCSPAPANLKIDGDISEWTARKCFRINSGKQVVLETDELLWQFNILWKGESDLSAKIWTGWTPEAFIIAMDVKDDNIKLYKDIPNREYLGDCAEIFIDGRNQSWSGSYSKGVYQIIWTPPDNTGGNGVLSDVSKYPAGTTAAGKLSPDGYTMEMRIPFTAENFPEFKAVPDAVLGFDAALDDFDAGMGSKRKIQAALNGSAMNHCDTTGFMRLRLVTDVIPAEPVVNGDFRDGAKGWKISGGAVAQDSGGPCLEFKHSDSKQSGGSAVQTITLDPEEWCKLSLDYQTDGSPGWSSARLDFAGSSVNCKIPELFLDRSGSGRWHSVSHHFYSGPGGKANLRLFFHRAEKEGEADIPASLKVKNIRVSPLTDADMAAEYADDGGFELGEPGFVPGGWARSGGRMGMPLFHVTDKESADGKKSMEITMGSVPSDVQGNDTLAALSGWKRLEPGKKYRFSCQGKASRDFKLYAAVEGPVAIYNPLFLTKDWKKYSFDITVPSEKENAAKRSSRVSFEGNYSYAANIKIWLDDISLKRLD